MGINQYRKAIDGEWPFDSSTQRYVFLELAYRSDYKGVVRMPQSEIAGVCLLSVATVKREMGKLQELGLLEREGHGRYRIQLSGEKIDRELEAAQNARDELYEQKPGGNYAIRFTTEGKPVVTDEESGHVVWKSP